MSQTGSKQAIVKDRGSKKAFVWRTDSQSMSQFASHDGDGEPGGGGDGDGGAFSFRPLSNSATSRDGLPKRMTPGTTSRGHRDGATSLPATFGGKMAGTKRPASGGLFQALSSGNNFRKKARA